MMSLSTGELLYLFYALAYSEDSSNSVTQGTIKRYLPKVHAGEANEICQSLLDKQLLESPKPRRVVVSGVGQQALVDNLKITDYRFVTSKGYRVTNTLLRCLQMASSASSSPNSIPEMTFENFVEKFKDFYFTEKQRQSSSGVYVIREKEILKSFANQYKISEELLHSYYLQLQEEGLISVAEGRKDKNLQWIE